MSKSIDNELAVLRVQFVPTIVLTLVVGHVADRYDRRRVVITCEIAQASFVWADWLKIASSGCR